MNRGIALLGMSVFLTGLVCSCGGDTSESTAPRFAILSAFPAEMAPYLAQTTVTGMAVVNGRVFRVGVLEGVSVVVGLTGIGLVNAAATTRALLEQFEVQGIVVSAVAGSTQLLIGDVAVPTTWIGPDSVPYEACQKWIELASAIAAPGAVTLERCTEVPAVTDEPVCLPMAPAVGIGGFGQSSDPFGGSAFPCQPGGNDVFGCDVNSAGTARTHALAPSLVKRGRNEQSPELLVTSADPAPAVVDMETAAIAVEAAAHGVPFIAFRAVSDGPGDPLGLPGFPAQFNAYYHLAADNAAAAMVAFLARVRDSGNVRCEL